MVSAISTTKVLPFAKCTLPGASLLHNLLECQSMIFCTRLQDLSYNFHQRTPLYVAARQGHKDVLEFLVADGIVNSTDNRKVSIVD